MKHLLLLLSVMFFFLACEEVSTQTEIYGSIMRGDNPNAGIPNLWVDIRGRKKGNLCLGDCDETISIDSVQTDANGYFEIVVIRHKKTDYFSIDPRIKSDDGFNKCVLTGTLDVYGTESNEVLIYMTCEKY